MSALKLIYTLWFDVFVRLDHALVRTGCGLLTQIVTMVRCNVCRKMSCSLRDAVEASFTSIFSAAVQRSEFLLPSFLS